MEQALHDVLLDFEHLTILTLVAGLLISASIRKVSGETLDDRKGIGKVRCSAYGGVDLVAALILMAYYYSLVLYGPQQGEPMAMSMELIVANLVLFLFQVTIVLVTVQWVGGRDPIELFGLRRVTLLQWSLWAGGGILVTTPLVLYLSEWTRIEWLEPIFGEMKEQDVVDSMKSNTGLGLRVGLVLTACIAAPVVEELVFRGYIYGVLKKFSNPLFAMVVAGALFAVVHVNLPALFPLWVFAILLTLSYELSGSLWVPIGIHAGFNTYNVVFMFTGLGEGAP